MTGAADCSRAEKAEERHVAPPLAARETRLLEALGVLFAILAVGALVLPVWLLLASPPQPAADIVAACKLAVKRGALGLPGYAAAGLLLAWGLAVALRAGPQLVAAAVGGSRAARDWQRTCAECELYLDGRPLRLRLLPADEAIAFTAGLLRPSIYISRGALRVLTAEERAAVLRHEHAHTRTRDPLRCLLIRLTLGNALVPRGAWLARRYSALREVHADNAAASVAGGTTALLGALGKFVPQVPEGACGLSDPALQGVARFRAAGTAGSSLLPLVMAAGVLVLALTAAVGLTDWDVATWCRLSDAPTAGQH